MTLSASHLRPGGAALASAPKARSVGGLRRPAVTAGRPLPFAKGINSPQIVLRTQF